MTEEQSKNKQPEQQPEQVQQAQEPNLYQQQAQNSSPFPEQLAEQYKQPEQQTTEKTTAETWQAGYDEETGILTREQFEVGFIGAFDVAGELTGLKSFPVKEYERPGAIKTADKLYQIALKYPVFRFLVDRKSYWLYDFSLIAGFIAMKTNDVLEEKFNVSIKTKLFGWLKWKKSEETGSGSGFLARLVRGKQQKQGN